ncbi:MAG: hypothetical protein LW715_15760, partial [Rhodobacter sp.]|nr:hypothetical protein [Rhodobacter sp.]
MNAADLDRGLVIVPAGAGAGKTHRIKTQLSDWVKRKMVRPERILVDRIQQLEPPISGGDDFVWVCTPGERPGFAGVVLFD